MFKMKGKTSFWLKTFGKEDFLSELLYRRKKWNLFFSLAWIEIKFQKVNLIIVSLYKNFANHLKIFKWFRLGSVKNV